MITILNAAPNTGNQGVSALCFSAVDGLAQRGINRIAIADHGRARRNASWLLGKTDRKVELFGLTHHRRIWRGDCLRTVRYLARIGGGASASARAILESDVCLDVSGGDSFTDLYGQKRFDAMTLSKTLALEAGKPLVLLPQTLGPFRSAGNAAAASDILRRAAAVWVRDAQSFALLKMIMGAAFDPARHRMGVDMALLLPSSRPTGAPFDIVKWLRMPRSSPVFGLNVSGLLCSKPEAAARQFGLAAPHDQQIEAAARAALTAHPRARLILVPHVLRDPTHPESDWAAATNIARRINVEASDRVQVLPQSFSATELKWLIARLDWFAGARMHATIAALSSGIPTLGLGYSDKTEGVFDAFGLGGEAIDLRRNSPEQLGAQVAASIASRGLARRRLARKLPRMLTAAETQMDDIARLVKELGG